MGIGFKHGGVAEMLNFKVVGGTAYPASPKENTIWINTDTEITGYTFSSMEPGNLTEGMVWIFTGESSPVAFSVTKKNPVMLYPISAKQYVAGVLVDKEAKSYQGGAWVDWWNGELYDIGNEYIAVTGGYDTVGKKYNTTLPGGSNPLTIKHTDTGMEITQDKDSSSGMWYIKNKINLTTFSKLSMYGIIHCDNSANPWRSKIAIYPSLDNDYIEGHAVATVTGYADHTNRTYTIDVTGLDGAYYIGGSLYCDNRNTDYIKIKKMRLE